MQAKVLKCSCRHPGQDAVHGDGNRVHNPLGIVDARNKIRAFRCTVCRDKKNARDDRIKAPKDVAPAVVAVDAKPASKSKRKAG